MTVRFEDFCACPICTSAFERKADSLVCLGCERRYDIRDGIANLRPDYDDPRRQRYVESYEALAATDIEEPVEGRRSYRHDAFLNFVGDVRGKRVLDVGSSNALYLGSLVAAFRVAFDIALPYLEAISADSGVARVCGDAEFLPFQPGAFDIVLVSDVLEHLLDPREFVHRLAALCSVETRVLVHVPWKERLESYRASGHEFAHLRSFDDFSFSDLWRDFSIVRRRPMAPNMEYPLPFVLADRLPLPLLNAIRARYFHVPGVAQREFERRQRRTAALPKRERLWLRFYDPAYMMYELRMARPEISWVTREADEEPRAYSTVKRALETFRAVARRCPNPVRSSQPRRT